MRVVVTGGAGFIGSHLVRALLAAPWVHEVVVMDDMSTGRRRNIAGLPVVLHQASILDGAALDETCRGAGAIVHLAARPSVPRSLDNPFLTHTVNASGTLAVLEAARRLGQPHVVVASSSSVYGDAPSLPKSEDLPCDPRSPYAASKVAAEAYARAHAVSFGMPVLTLRFFNVFGPRQAADHAYAAVVPAFVSAAVRGVDLPVHGDGSQTRDFTYVESVVRVLVAAVRRRVVHDGPVNCAFGTRRSLRDVIATLEGVIGQPLTTRRLPARLGDVQHSQADTTRLRALFPDVTPVAFEDALRETLAWTREQVDMPVRTPRPVVSAVEVGA